MSGIFQGLIAKKLQKCGLFKTTVAFRIFSPSEDKACIMQPYSKTRAEYVAISCPFFLHFAVRTLQFENLTRDILFYGVGSYDMYVFPQKT